MARYQTGTGSQKQVLGKVISAGPVTDGGTVTPGDPFGAPFVMPMAPNSTKKATRYRGVKPIQRSAGARV